jgi:hypothetical protein
MSRHQILLGALVCAAAAAVETVQAETTQERRRLAQQLIAEALHREIYGELAEREALLRRAEALDPDFPAVRWRRGYVWRDGDWIASDDAPQKYSGDRRWIAYRIARQEHPDTLEGHLTLAAWCRSEELPEQERAHLHRVLEFDNSHPFARERLGFQQIGGRWASPQDRLDALRHEEAIRKSLAAWSEPLRQIVQDLEARSERTRARALEQLLAIEAVDAVPALERVVSPSSEANAQRVLQVLKRIQHRESTRSLARHAVLAPWEAVRKEAAERLRDRPLEEYAPSLLSELYTPLATFSQVAPGPGGRLLYRHAFVREGQGQHELMVLDTAYTRVTVPGGDRRETLGRAMLNLSSSASAREWTASQQNDFQAELNSRIGAALKTATQANVVDAPEHWWRWWNEVNEVFVEEKPTSVIRRQQEVRIADRPPPEIGGPRKNEDAQAAEEESPQESETGDTPAPRPARRRPQGNNLDARLMSAEDRIAVFGAMDCLAAGTLVWTLTGPMPIEKLLPGDMVLSQDAESGELNYKPVLRTTVRPRGTTFRVTAESETIAASSGHLFWVAGEGWVKARHLAPGQELHSRDGAVRVSSVEPGEEVETFNLEVADFHSYFVGEGKVLCHDNTVRQPTTAIVPGLAP